MLKSLEIQNFTLFDHATIHWSSGLNILIGENGTGKSQLMKLAYSLSWVSAEQAKARRQSKDALQKRIADKLVATCRPESLGRLVSRQQGRNRCDVSVKFADPTDASLSISFSTNSRSDVKLEQAPDGWLKAKPIFIPTREMLSIFSGFTAVYEEQQLEFEETYYDLAKALNANARKRHSERVQQLIERLETLLGGHIKLENGRFYLSSYQEGRGKFEMPLLAEGLRKLAMLAYLLINGSLREHGTLFWDEPEANLNPKLMVVTAEVLVSLAQQGFQIILATHSLFLLRELEICLKKQNDSTPVQYIALGRSGDTLVVEQSDDLAGIDPLVMLDQELMQSDRYLELP